MLTAELLPLDDGFGLDDAEILALARLFLASDL